MEGEHYLRSDFSLESDKLEFYNEKLKKSIISADFVGVKSSIDNLADLHKRYYWCYWYAIEHTEESEEYGNIIIYLRDNGAITQGDVPPEEPVFERIYIADTL